MTRARKMSMLETYRDGPERILKILSSAAPAALDYKKEASYWSIRENIAHLLDGDCHGFIRYRTAIAEPGSPIFCYNEDKWTANLGYGMQDVGSCLNIMKMLRAIVFSHLSTMLDADWSQFCYMHPEQGSVNIGKWLEIYIGHIDFHEKLIQRNLDDQASAAGLNHPAL